MTIKFLIKFLDSLCVIMNVGCGLLENIHICELKTALQFSYCTVSPGINSSDCDWVGFQLFGVSWLQQDS